LSKLSAKSFLQWIQFFICFNVQLNAHNAILMKRVTAFFISILVCQFGFAQQKPQYTQYVMNNFILNPAIAGIENYVDLKAGYRAQWQGLDGAPVTSYISIHAPIGNINLSTPRWWK